MHSIEGPTPSIVADDAIIHMGSNVDIVGTIHGRGIIIWHIHLDLSNSVTKYSVEWNIDLGYHLETKPIFRSRRTEFFTMAMEAQVLVEVPMELVELLTKLRTDLRGVLGAHSQDSATRSAWFFSLWLD